MDFLAGPLAGLLIILMVLAKVLVIGLPLLFLALVAWATLCWAENEFSRENSSGEDNAPARDDDGDDPSDDQNLK